MSRRPPSPPPPPPAATSTSTSLTTTSNGSHQFSIAGYSLSKGIGVGKFIASEAFEVGGHRWAVYFYPDGKAPGDGRTTYVSLFVALVSDETDVRALFELSLLDQSGKGLHKVHTHFGRSLQTGPYMLKCRGSMWGYKRFFKRDALDTSDYVKDDCLLVHCNVGVVKSSTEVPMSWYITVPSSSMGEQFGELLESGKGADVCFEIEGEVFVAHKLVLAARSPVFCAQFFGPLKDHNKSLIKIDDMEASIFKALLHFMYHDALPDIREFSSKEDPKLVSTIFAQHLLAAADRYGLERLRLLCEAQLCEEISNSTVATTLALAEQHHCFHLKAACLRFIASQENFRAVMKTDGFEYLTVSCPSLLTELLKHVARMDEQSVSLSLLGNKESDVPV